MTASSDNQLFYFGHMTCNFSVLPRKKETEKEPKKQRGKKGGGKTMHGKTADKCATL